MKKISSNFINLSKKIKTQDLKLSINNGELTVQEVHLMPVNIFNSIPISRLKAKREVIAKELKYSFEGQLFKTIMQQVEITVKNASEIKGKNIDFQYGILVNNEFEYVDMGEYYIKDVEDDKNKEELIVTGYDKMINFMKTFKQSDLKLTYPCKMSKLVSRMGEICGVELYSTDFYNSNLIVDEDFFTIQELTYRDVLEKIAQTTLTTIFIKENKLYLCKIGDSVQTLDTSFLSNLVIGEKFGPVNALVLGRGSVEDNIESIDKQSINTNGRCEIRFDENEFIDNKREQVIDEMLQQINGLEYYAIEASNLGLLWLEPCDVITVKDREESSYKSIYLKASITINTGIKGEMKADIPEATNTEYKVTTKEEKKTLKVERLAKKNEGLIIDIIEENKETSNKLSKHEQTIDSMKDTLSSQETKIETVESKADTANTNAQNAQKTANANTTKITTNTTKITEVEKTVDGINQKVSKTEEKIENVSTDLSTNHYTKTEVNSQINQKADSITSSVSKTYSTKTETNNKLKDYTKIEELGTQIEQNWEHIKYAWNQISEFIQMEILNGNASLAFRRDSNNLLMALDKLGQHFYKNDGKTLLGNIGVDTDTDGNVYLNFSTSMNYGQNNSTGMAWGVKTTSDGKFHPIMYLKNYNLIKNGGSYGQLELANCDLILNGSYEAGNGGSVILGNLTMTGNMQNGISFVDDEGNYLFTIYKGDGSVIAPYDTIKILDNIEFYKNQAGSNSFRIGDKEGGYVLLTDDGDIGASGNITINGQVASTKVLADEIIAINNMEVAGKSVVKGDLQHDFRLHWDGGRLHFWVDNTDQTGNISDKRLKTGIKEVDKDLIKAIGELNYKQFKKDNRNGLISVGIIAQDLIEILNKYGKNAEKYEILEKFQYKLEDETTYYGIDYEQFLLLRMMSKEEEIKELQEKDKQKDEIIKDLIKRIEKLEGGNHE